MTQEIQKSKAKSDSQNIGYLLFIAAQLFLNIFFISVNKITPFITSALLILLIIFVGKFIKCCIENKQNYTRLTIISIVVTLAILPLFIISNYIHYFPHESKDRVNEYTNEKIPHVFLGEACRIEGICLDNVAVFYGGITKESKESFETFIIENLVKTVCLSSGGGKTDEAEAISDIINEKGLNTCMADYYYNKKDAAHINPLMSLGCSSACNLLLLSADVRIRNASLVRFKGHQYAVTNTYSQIFESWGWGWFYKSSNISEEPSIVSAFNRLKTKDKPAHILYAEKLEEIGHLAEMKQLNNKMLEEFKIFTEVIPAKEKSD